MNEIAKIDTKAVAVQGTGSLAALAKLAGKMNQRYIRGAMLKFKKGDFFAGQDEEEVPVGTRFVLNYDNWLHGWVRWSDKRPSDQIMEPIMMGNEAPKRDTLPDQDRDEWDTDDKGSPQDPWQETHYILMKDPNADGEESLYTFTTHTKTGRKSMWRFLNQATGKLIMHPQEYPIVELKVGHYDDDDYGRVKYPEFKIVGWSPKDVFDKAMAEEAATAEAQAAADRELEEFGEKLGGKIDYAKASAVQDDDVMDMILGSPEAAPAPAQKGKAKTAARF